MHRKIVAFFSIAFLFVYSLSKAQTCPPNIDFELGNTSFWLFYTGVAVQLSPTDPQVSFTSPTLTPPIVGRHTLTTGIGVDAVGGFPIVAPGGGSYSLKLGDAVTGQLAERARFFVHIPPGASDYSLVYRYAVVIQDGGGGHDSSSQPRFNVEVFDSISGVIAPCAEFSYFIGGPLPGYQPFPASAGGAFAGYYKGWTTSSINLSGLGGTTMRVDFTALDCAFGGHYGYGYLDLTCGLFAVSVNTCNDTVASLNAPEGFATYEWYDSTTFTIHYGSGQSITLPLPPYPTTYAVIIAPYQGYGCPDTLYTRIAPSHLVVNARGDTSVCLGKHAFLDAGASDVALPLTYRWLPSGSLNCATCATPTATIPGTTLYTVTVTNNQGCHKSDTVRVTQLKLRGTVDSTNARCFGDNNGTATVIPLNGFFPYTYSWTTTPIQTTSLATALVAGTYTVTVIDSQTCRFDTFVTIHQPPPTVLSVGATVNPIHCGGHEGSITLNGLRPDSVYVINYLYNGSPATITLTVAPTDTFAILTALPAGSYTNIGIGGSMLCTYNMLPGPYVLFDPPFPALPGVGSNSPICAGQTLQLASYSATPGVVYKWTGPGGFTSVLDTPGAISTATFTNAGLYTVAVTINSCTSTDTTRVIIKPNPEAFAGNNSAVCEGDTLKLTSGSYTGGTVYSWVGPNRYVSAEQNPMIVNAAEEATGTYTVTVTLDGCSDTANTLVLVRPMPLAPVVNDTFYCQGAVPSPLPVVGTGLRWYKVPTGGTAVGWPSPPTGVPGKTTWYVSQTSGTCTGPRASISATVYPHNVQSLVLSDSVICGGNYISFNMLNTLNAKEDYQGITWNFGSGDSVQNVNPAIRSFDVTKPTSITLTATVYHKYCPDTVVTRTIRAFPYPVVHLGADTSICAGSSPITIGDYINENKLSAGWRWNTGQTGPRITVDKPGMYYAKVTIDGCATTDTIMVKNDCYTDIPNVFTPNGDGVNDYFFPRQYLSSGLSSFSMDIYNRWGQQVYTTKSIDGRGWDGKYNDVPQSEGVFIYNIDATFKDGKIEHHQGNVTLLR